MWQTKSWHWHVIRFTSYVFLPIGMFWYASDPSHFEKSIIKSNLEWSPPIDYKAVDQIERLQKRIREEKLAELKDRYEQHEKAKSM